MNPLVIATGFWIVPFLLQFLVSSISLYIATKLLRFSRSTYLLALKAALVASILVSVCVFASGLVLSILRATYSLSTELFVFSLFLNAIVVSWIYKERYLRSLGAVVLVVLLNGALALALWYSGAWLNFWSLF